MNEKCEPFVENIKNKILTYPDDFLLLFNDEGLAYIKENLKNKYSEDEEIDFYLNMAASSNKSFN